MRICIGLIAFLLYACPLAAQPFADVSRYLVDSLEYGQLGAADQRLIDSVMNKYHQSDQEDKLLLVNLIVDGTWDNRVWPRYNKWILDRLEAKKASAPLDSAHHVLYAGCLINHGYYMRIIGKIEEALQWYHKSYAEYEKLQNEEGLAYCLNNMAVIHENIGDLPKSLEYYHQALSIQEKIGERVGEANSLVNIGDVHDKMGDDDKALEFLEKALRIQQEIKERRDEAHTTIKMAQIYVERKDYARATELQERSLRINEELQDTYGIASSLAEIGKTQYFQRNNTEAIATLHKAIALYEKVYEKHGAAVAGKMLASAYFEEGMLSEAETTGRQSLAAAEELGFIDLISSASLLLSDVYTKKGNTDQALYYYKRHIALRDSATGEANKKLTIRMQLQHDYEKQKAIDDTDREAQIALANAEKNRQRMMSIGLGLIGLLTIVFASIVVNRLRVTRRQKTIIAETNEELQMINEEILAQRDEIEHQKQVVEKQRDDIIASITYAKRIQEAILPSLQAMNQAMHDGFVLYQPKDVVAGDFYWMEQVNDKVYIAVADCTGHGVPGAMVSVICSNALTKALLEENIEDPAKLLDRTREIVIQKLAKGGEDVRDGMDISLAVIDRSTMTLEWAGANNPLYLLRHAAVSTTEASIIDIIKGDRQPIGFVQHPQPFTAHRLSLQPGDGIYLFTDGYADQFGGAEGKKMGYQKFRELLIDISHQSMKEQKEMLMAFFEQWKGSEEQVDDVCVVGIKM